MCEKDPREAEFRRTVDAPNVTIEETGEDGFGLWASIVFSGTKQQYRDYVSRTDGIVHGGPLRLGQDGVQAEVRLD